MTWVVLALLLGSFDSNANIVGFGQMFDLTDVQVQLYIISLLAEDQC